jgi:probable phosphoglycerate mutase
VICLLIRHASTDTAGRNLTGWLPGVHLNPEGRAQAERLAGRLANAGIRAIYASPLERTRETAEPLARRLGLAVETCEQLGEIHCGDWTGRDIEDLKSDPLWNRFNSSRSSTRIPGGELMLETQARMVTALERMRQRHSDEAIAVISHGDPIRATVAHYAGVPLDFLPRLEVYPASVSVLGLHDWGAQILRLNDTSGCWPE